MLMYRLSLLDYKSNKFIFGNLENKDEIKMTQILSQLFFHVFSYVSFLPYLLLFLPKLRDSASFMNITCIIYHLNEPYFMTSLLHI